MIQRYNDTKIKPPEHHYITKLLIKRKFLVNVSELDLYAFWDSLFDEVLRYYEFQIVIICVGYTVSRIANHNGFKDENGEPIKNLNAYFRVALLSNIKKYTTPVYIDWLEED